MEQKVKAAKAVELARKKAADAVRQFAAKGALKTRTTGAFGYSDKGNVPDIGNAPDMMEAAFKLTAAAPVANQAVQGGQPLVYPIRLEQRIEAPKAEFDKTKQQIKQKLLPKKQEEALAAWTKGLREKAKIEINQTLIAEK